MPSPDSQELSRGSPSQVHYQERSSLQVRSPVFFSRMRCPASWFHFRVLPQDIFFFWWLFDNLIGTRKMGTLSLYMWIHWNLCISYFSKKREYPWFFIFLKRKIDGQKKSEKINILKNCFLFDFFFRKRISSLLQHSTAENNICLQN